MFHFAENTDRAKASASAFGKMLRAAVRDKRKRWYVSKGVRVPSYFADDIDTAAKTERTIAAGNTRWTVSIRWQEKRKQRDGSYKWCHAGTLSRPVHEYNYRRVAGSLLRRVLRHRRREYRKVCVVYGLDAGAIAF